MRLLASRQVGTSNDGYFDGLSLQAVTPVPNLVQNGNAEAPVVTTGTVPGWTSVAGSTWGIYTRTICPDCPAAFDGQQYFFAGAVASGELAQDVDVTSYAGSIDADMQSFAFSANVAAYNQVPTDGSRTIVEYRDGAGNILSTFDSTEIRSINIWIRIADVRRAPPGTRRIRIRLLAIRHNGTNNDGYFDGVALRPVSTEFPSGESLALNGPAGLAVGPDGSVYVADRNNHRVVRFRPDGSASIVAGTGEAGSGGDEGPATSASLSSPTSVAISSDGSIYIADLGNQKVRRVAVDGTIGTVAGTGEVGYSGDGGAAIDARLYDPIAVAVGPDGSVYIAERSNHVIRRIVPDGTLETVAGSAFPGYGGDGGAAKQAQLNRPSGVAVASDGTLYIADDFNHRVRRVRAGKIRTEVGAGILGDAGDGGQAVTATLASLSAVAVGPDRALYLADNLNRRLRSVSGTLPGLGASDIGIPRDGRSEVDIFDARGRHLRTVNVLTGATLFQFTYDAQGRLSALTDIDGNVTQIERDSAGRPTAILAPFGQRTEVDVDGNGYLARVSDPLGNETRFGYGADGLLTSETDVRGNLHSYEYEADGRLKKDSDPAGGTQTLSRTGSLSNYTVSRTSALGRTTSYGVSFNNGAIARSITLPSGLTNNVNVGVDGTSTVTQADGTQSTSIPIPDPRFGLLAPLNLVTTALPSGLTSIQTESKSVVLSDPHNPLSLVSQTATTTSNGRPTTTVFDAGTKTFTTTTPAGRVTVRTIDGKGRTTRLQVADLAPIYLAYDLQGRVSSVTQGTRVSLNQYFPAGAAAGYLQSSTDPLSQTTSYTRDALGRVLSETLAAITTGTTWDPAGNLKTVTPSGKPAHSLNYTPADLVSQYDPPAAGLPTSSMSYSYDVDRALPSSDRNEALR